MEHKLMIKSLHDGIAECKCGGWHYSFTGKTTVGEITKWWLEHVSQHIESEIGELGKTEVIRITYGA